MVVSEAVRTAAMIRELVAEENEVEEAAMEVEEVVEEEVALRQRRMEQVQAIPRRLGS